MTEPGSSDLRARYPDVFDRPIATRLATPAMIAGAFAIFLFGLVDLDFSPSRMLAGLSQLGWIVMLMIPPDPGTSLHAYLVALGETLSIALLGTTLAALFALPVSLLAARNIVPSNLFRFPVLVGQCYSFFVIFDQCSVSLFTIQQCFFSISFFRYIPEICDHCFYRWVIQFH